MKDLEEELFISKLDEDLQNTYWPESKVYLEKSAQIRNKMTDAVKLTEELAKLVKEFMAMADPLNTLHGIFSRLKSKEQYESLSFPWDDEQQKFRQFTEIMADEKRISALPKILKHFSDVFFAISSGGPMAASKLRLISDLIPEESPRRGPVPIGRKGIKARLEPSGALDILKSPGRYDRRDVLKYGIEAANRK